MVSVIIQLLFISFALVSSETGDIEEIWKYLKSRDAKILELEREISDLRLWKSNFEKEMQGKNKHERFALADSRVAFSTYMQNSFNAVQFGRSRTFIYKGIKCNVGNGYDSYYGTFKAPVSGTYAFTWTACASGQDEGEMGVQLIIEGVIHGAIYVDSEEVNDEDCATGFVIRTLQVGDHVSTRSGPGGPQGSIKSNDDARTTFSGWLLFQ